MATYSLDSVSRITTRVTPTTNGHLVKQNLRQCSCGEEGNVVGQFEDWAILFKCPSSLGNQNCVPWVSCFRCATSQIRFTTMAQLKRHRKKFHAPQHTHDLQQSEASMSVEATEDNDAMPYGESVDDSASSDNTHQSDMHEWYQQMEVAATNPEKNTMTEAQKIPGVSEAMNYIAFLTGGFPVRAVSAFSTNATASTPVEMLYYSRENCISIMGWGEKSPYQCDM